MANIFVDSIREKLVDGFTSSPLERFGESLKGGFSNVKSSIIASEERKVKSQLGKLAFGGLLILGIAAIARR